MKTLIINFKWMLALLILFTACDPYGEEDLELGPPPTAEDAAINMTVNAENDNIIHFKNTSSAFLKVWDFGNGSGAKGDDVTGVFPLKGTYEVTLTVYTSGGSISSSTTIDIAETDPLLLDIPVYNMLTGGADAVDGKTWVIDATRAAHFGVGPNPSDPAVGDYPNWYAAGVNEKAGSGLYNDKFTFKLDGFGFMQETDGDVFINTLQAGNFPGAYENAGDYTAPFTAPDNLTWSVSEDGAGNQVISIKNGGFIGYFTGTYSYQIVSLEENELFIRYEDAANPGLAWYQRLVPEGFTAPPPPPPAVSTLPIDFEGALPPFNGFGGSTYQVIDNPDATGINTSAKVGEYVKGTEGNWAGIETALDAKIDFSTLSYIKYKVHSPVTGRALFKLESVDGTATPVEVFADITKTGEWEELSFDFSSAASDTYDKIAMFLDFDNNSGGTFYIDDIRQAAPPIALPLTFESVEPVVFTFGNSTQEFVDNPDASGINTSSRVLKTIHGNEPWAGLYFDLDQPLDFSAQTTIKVKVWAPQTGTFRLKLENISDGDDFKEYDVDVTTANTWVELQFDVSSAASNTYARVVLFPGWNVSNAGTFYLDDIVQE